MGEQQAETAGMMAEGQVEGGSKSQPASHKGRGGARPGAGRKAKWGEKTVVMRVPVSMREAVEEFLSLKAQGVELARADEVAAQMEQAAQAAREQALAEARAEIAAAMAAGPSGKGEPASTASPAQIENQSVPSTSSDAVPPAPAKPKKPRAPRKKKTQDAGIDPSRQGSLFDLL